MANVQTVRPQPPRAPRSIDAQYNIVFFWKQNDSDIYGRRPDMLVKYLARHPKIHQIVHFDPPISWEHLRGQVDLNEMVRLTESPIIYTHTLARYFELADTEKVKRRTFIYSDTRPGVVFPSRDGYMHYIARTLDANQITTRRTIFWVCPKNFEFPDVIRTFKPEMVLADVIDDHRQWSVKPNYRERLEQNYRDILGASHIVLANNTTVKEAMAAFASDIHVVANGCEELYHESRAYDCPDELKALRGPIVGYVGNLDPTRLDIDLLEFVATEHPEWNLVLIGSLHSNRNVLALDRYPNVHILGVRKYDQAVRYIKNFDVAIIPHIDNNLTRSMNPLKAYVYCSLGVPVVTTSIQNIADVRTLVQVARSRCEFVARIEACLRQELSPPAELHLGFIRNNMWRERVAQIVDLIDRAWERRECNERG